MLYLFRCSSSGPHVRRRNDVYACSLSWCEHAVHVSNASYVVVLQVDLRWRPNLKSWPGKSSSPGWFVFSVEDAAIASVFGHCLPLKPRRGSVLWMRIQLSPKSLHRPPKSLPILRSSTFAPPRGFAAGKALHSHGLVGVTCRVPCTGGG